MLFWIIGFNCGFSGTSIHYVIFINVSYILQRHDNKNVSDYKEIIKKKYECNMKQRGREYEGHIKEI